MLEEVLSRVDLIIAVEGSRKISRENLDFLFDKYELSPEDREKVLKACEDKHITIFRESSKADAAKTVKEEPVNEEKKEEPKTEKKGFFKKLFGL